MTGTTYHLFDMCALVSTQITKTKLSEPPFLPPFFRFQGSNPAFFRQTPHIQQSATVFSFFCRFSNPDSSIAEPLELSALPADVSRERRLSNAYAYSCNQKNREQRLRFFGLSAEKMLVFMAGVLIFYPPLAKTLSPFVYCPSDSFL